MSAHQTRIYNFGAGPGTIVESVLQRAQTELLNWQQTGMSVLEISHRSAAFMALVSEAKAKLRTLLNINDDYEVLFTMGPTRAQFAAVPLNLCEPDQTVGHIDSGIWSHMAVEEAQKYNRNLIVASSREAQYRSLPDMTQHDFSKAAYLHYCDNETINGLEVPLDFHWPEVPRVVDMTSNFLSRAINVTDYDLIYAGAQKNFGAAGLVVVIVKKELLGRARTMTPTTLNYQIQSENDSLYYTPCTFAIYLANFIFDWMLEQGGVATFEALAKQRSEKLYQYIDSSSFYRNQVESKYRSRLNIPFLLADESQNKAFLEQAEARGLCALKGHRFVGGMRASLYNAMPMSGVEALIAFMKEFESSIT